jgi:hypothetical protein
MRTPLLVIAIIVVCAFGQLNAANYYMSPNGNDNNSGTSTTNAWATLGHARDILAAGDTLFVMGGTYSTPQVWVGGNGGNTRRPIVIKAYGDAVANFTTPGTIESNNYYFLFWGGTDIGHIVVDGESYINPGDTRYFNTFTTLGIQLAKYPLGTAQNIHRGVESVFLSAAVSAVKLRITYSSMQITASWRFSR